MTYTIPSYTVQPGSVYQPKTNPYILDQIGGVVGCWSTRQLMAAGSGNVIRGRDATTNEADYTSAAYPAGIVTLANGGDAFCPALYDQSGGGNNATQTTAASQPKLVDTGALITSGGVGVMDFDGVNDGINIPSQSAIKSLYLNIKTSDTSFVIGYNPSDPTDGILISVKSDVSSLINRNSGSPVYYKNAVFQNWATRSDVDISLSVGSYLSLVITGLDLSGYVGGLNLFDRSVFPFSGQANDIIAFDKNLTQSEVAQLHNAIAL